MGSKVDIGSTLVEQVLCNMQVSPLAGQVEGCGTDGHLAVHTPVHRQQEPDTSPTLEHFDNRVEHLVDVSRLFNGQHFKIEGQGPQELQKPMVGINSKRE